MNIRARDLRTNRNSFAVGVDAHHDLRTRIRELWRTYTESDDRDEADAAYTAWCLLVNELDAMEFSQ